MMICLSQQWCDAGEIHENALGIDMATPSISPADRIRDLSNINGEVALLLESAGQAINSLTDRPVNSPDSGDEDTNMNGTSEQSSLKDHREAFASHTKAYYTHLQAIIARLRRQAYALEEAGIISAEAPSTAIASQSRQNMGQGQGRGQFTAQEPERITNGGLGNLDVGWLNSRGTKVAAEKESELIQEAKELLEESLAKNDDLEMGGAT